MIRVVLPFHLRTLANVGAEVQLDLEGPVTTGAILDALEARYPMLCGTVRDHETHTRRPRIRFFAAEEDVTHHSPDVYVHALNTHHAIGSVHSRTAALAAFRSFYAEFCRHDRAGA